MTNEIVEKTKRLEIDPKVGRFIEVLDVAEKVARQKFGTSIDGLRQQGETKGDYSKIQEVVGEADKIVGPEDQFVMDFKVWQETRQAGSHKMGFSDWRKSRNEAYKIELDRLGKELGK